MAHYRAELLYAAMGLVLMFVAYKIFDWLSPKIDFEDELKKGNIAVAIFVASIFITIGMVIGGALKRETKFFFPS
jgi:putative membrane protein